MKKVFVILLALCFVGAASAAVSSYSQDFEGLDAANPDALGWAGDGWNVYGNVFGPDWAYWYGYGPFSAPNGTGAFSNVATGQGGPDQGAQQLVVFSDYNNGDHANGAHIESIVYREWAVEAADVGSTWTFSFDYKMGDLGGASTANAFIKTLDPGAGWAMTNYITLDTTSAPVTWSSGSLSIYIDPLLENQILQIGFSNFATLYEPSGVFYDNINFVPEPATLALLGLGGLLLRRKK